jgi:hypothetical protein
MLVVDSQPTLELYRECGFNSLLRHHSTRPELRRGARSWQAVRRAEANVLSERSESKGSQQLSPLHTLTATAAPNSPVRGDARGATVGQFAGKPRGWPAWVDCAATDRVVRTGSRSWRAGQRGEAASAPARPSAVGHLRGAAGGG